MHWWEILLGRRDDSSEEDRDAFARRAAELRERHERLERLAIEADVVSRVETPEEPHPWVGP